MLNSYESLVGDVLGAIAAIQTFTDGLSSETYAQSHLVRSACERQLEIIGEAMTRLRDQHPERFDQVERGSAIIGLRNRLIHGYDAVDSEIVWHVLTSRLVGLRANLERLLETP